MFLCAYCVRAAIQAGFAGFRNTSDNARTYFMHLYVIKLTVSRLNLLINLKSQSVAPLLNEWTIFDYFLYIQEDLDIFSGYPTEIFLRDSKPRPPGQDVNHLITEVYKHG